MATGCNPNSSEDAPQTNAVPADAQKAAEKLVMDFTNAINSKDFSKAKSLTTKDAAFINSNGFAGESADKYAPLVGANEYKFVSSDLEGHGSKIVLHAQFFTPVHELYGTNFILSNKDNSILISKIIPPAPKTIMELHTSGTSQAAQ